MRYPLPAQFYTRPTALHGAADILGSEAGTPRMRQPAKEGNVVDDQAALRRRLEFLVGVPATDGNEIDVFRNGEEIFPAMVESIQSARRTVDLVTFVFESGPPAEEVGSALADRARHGCRVRLLLDGMGSIQADRDLIRSMRRDGVDVRFFRKPWLRSPFSHNHRTHRKVLVVDGVEAFTGGVGIAENWGGDAREPGEWRDTQIRVRGPAVAGLGAAFVQNWAENSRIPDRPDDEYPEITSEDGHVVQVVRGTATVGWDNMRTVWHVLLTAAKERITLQTAYFAPDDGPLDLLRLAISRGVRVQVLLPGPNADSALSRIAAQSHFEAMLEAGVEVWCYQPTMLHTKILTIDGEVAMIGSPNFNRRSFDHDEEVACIILGGDAPRTLANHFEEDLTRSEQVAADEWRERGLLRRAAERATVPIERFL